MIKENTDDINRKLKSTALCSLWLGLSLAYPRHYVCLCNRADLVIEWIIPRFHQFTFWTIIHFLSIFTYILLLDRPIETSTVVILKRRECRNYNGGKEEEEASHSSPFYSFSQCREQHWFCLLQTFFLGILFWIFLEEMVRNQCELGIFFL